MELPFDTTGLGEEDKNRFSAVHSALRSKFNIQPTGHIDFNLQQFEAFKNYLDISVRNSYVIRQDNNNDCYVLFIDTLSKNKHENGHITDHHDHQVWALAYLKQDFGRVKIRPETLTDKILELVHPIELDFPEDRAFSDTFYLLISDHEKALAAIDRNFRNTVMDIREYDLLIEIVEHTLVIGSHKPISPDIAVHLAEFVSRLCSHC